MVKSAIVHRSMFNLVKRAPVPSSFQDLVAFDDGSVVMVTKSDLEGYDLSSDARAVENEIWADLSVVYRVRVAGQAAVARISCLVQCSTRQNSPRDKVSRESRCSIRTDHLGSISADIQVY